jgi:hypothetical protein
MSVSVALRAGEESARAGARPPRGRLFWLRSALGCVAVILGLALLSRERAGDDPAPRPVRPAVLVAPPSPWQPLPAAKRQYAVDAPELRSLAQGFEARRHADGGREDKLVYGVFESEAPYLRLAVFRGAADAAAPRGFFIDLARRAGEAGLGVMRIGRPAVVATKLGPLEVADAVLADGFERPCQAFRLQAESGLAVHGWHCGAGAEAPQRQEAACLVDRLFVLPGADDQGLKAVFTAAERQRPPSCEPRAADAKRKGA